MKKITCTAPVNIALIKYWGKRDEKLILPINSSLSITLDQNQLCATTTVTAGADLNEDRIWLNGLEESISKPRIQNVLKEIRCRSKLSELDEFAHVHIVSTNNFPTAAGLASSAAGYACLVFALAKLYEVDGEISDIARLGSGSACRSIYGGFVEWKKGTSVDGVDSHAVQIENNSYWPQLRILILVVNASKKSVSSTSGMQTSVATSDLLKTRSENIVPARLDEAKLAIKEKKFHDLTNIIMQESNQLHAICLDTLPPILYLNDVSKTIMKLVHQVNDYFGVNKLCYTFDAGPNAFIIVEEDNVPLVYNLIKTYFPPANKDSFLHGLEISEEETSQNLIEFIRMEPTPGAIDYVIHTKVGSGPQVLNR